MRKCLLIFLTLLVLLAFTIPASAAVNLNVNGNTYQPATSLQLQEGTTMVPLYVIERLAGADITISDQSITIQENDKTMTLTVGSTQATLNDDLVTLLQAPAILNDEIMVPIRAVMEGLGATIDWEGETHTVIVSFQEQRNNMTPEDMLLKSTEALTAYNTYKAKVDMHQNMQMLNPNTGEAEQVEMQMLMEMAIQNDPILAYIKAEGVNVTDELIQPEDMNMEMVINEDGMFMTMPGEGWVKLPMQGMDIGALLKESSQDPLESLQQLSETGALLSFGRDQEIDGQLYWVLNATMGPDSFSQLLNQVLGDIPLTEGQGSSEELGILNKLFNEMRADIFYNMLINQETLIPEFMNSYTTMEINTQIPNPDTEEAILIDIDLQQIASYEYYDLGEPIVVPDLSEAQELNLENII